MNCLPSCKVSKCFDTTKKKYYSILLCGLDGSGKTTMIKHYSQDLKDFADKYKTGGPNEAVNPHANSEFYYTTPYINIEKVNL